MKEVTINKEQKLFVIPAGDEGYTCHGFDNLFKELKALSLKLNQLGIDVGPVKEAEIGTMAQYAQHSKAVSLIGTRNLGTWFHHVRYLLNPSKKNIIIAITAICVVLFCIYSGIKSANANTGMVGTAAAGIVAHNAAIEQVAAETR